MDMTFFIQTANRKSYKTYHRCVLFAKLKILNSKIFLNTKPHLLKKL